MNAPVPQYSESHYLHGTEPDEQQRLAKLNDLLNTSCLQELRLSGGERILDVGSGLGQFTRAMKRAVGSTGTIVAVERSPIQYLEARRLAAEVSEEGSVDWRMGDAVRMPLRDDEWGSFDLAHTRFLLEHVTDPLAVVRSMVQAVRPDGRVVLLDDSHDVLRIWPSAPAFERLWEAYTRSYIQVGNDPYVGHKLVELLSAAGAAPVRNTWLFFGSCGGQPELFAAYCQNIIGILQGVRVLLLDLQLSDEAEFDQGIAEFRDWSLLPHAALWYAISWAEGRKLS